MLVFLSLTACQQMVSGEIKFDVTEVSCKAFKPITWSKQDTRETQDQIVEHNAVYVRICKK